MEINVGSISELRTQTTDKIVKFWFTMSVQKSCMDKSAFLTSEYPLVRLKTMWWISRFLIRTCRLVLWCFFVLKHQDDTVNFLRRNTWIVAQANNNKRIVLLSTIIKNQMLNTLHILVPIMKYLNLLEKNVHVTKS